MGLGTPVADTSQSVTVYQVEGEILTTLQSSASSIDPQRAEQVANVVSFAAGVLSDPFVTEQAEQRLGSIGDFSVLANAQGSDLLTMAEAAGQPVALNALDANNAIPAQSAAEFFGVDGLATRSSEILDQLDTKLEAVANVPWYAALAVKAGASGEISRQAYSDA